MQTAHGTIPESSFIFNLDWETLTRVCLLISPRGVRHPSESRRAPFRDVGLVGHTNLDLLDSGSILRAKDR